MPTSKSTKRSKPQETEREHLVRVEIRWSPDAREVGDLSHLAKQMKGNPAKRAEASTYVLYHWSRVLHGELSPGAFWELFGVALPPPYPAMYSGMAPPPLPLAQEKPVQEEDPEAHARKQRRAQNRKAVANEYV